MPPNLKQLRAAGAEIWDDRPARACALVAVACLWATAAFTEPGFLPLVAAALFALRFRLRHKPAPLVEDWL